MGPWVRLAWLALLFSIPPTAGCQRSGAKDQEQLEQPVAATGRQSQTQSDAARSERANARIALDQEQEPNGNLERESQVSADPALALIEKLKGSFQVDEQSPGRPVVVVDLSFTAATDADLSHLKRLTAIQELYLIDTKITDAGLEHLRAYSSLRTLDLARSRVADLGLPRLAGLESLRTLGLSGTKITDAGLIHLKRLSKLQTLDVSDTGVTEAGFQSLRVALSKTAILR
jgi:hypothetical protein